MLVVSILGFLVVLVSSIVSIVDSPRRVVLSIPPSLSLVLVVVHPTQVVYVP